jgi:integrase
VRRAYWLFVLLIGMRPGEAARLRWADVDCKKRTLTIRNAKGGADIVVPMSSAIARALRLARDGTDERNEWVFPGSGKSGHVARGDDGLPISGHALRHNYRNLCVECGVPEIEAHLLLGHAPAGVSSRYLHVLALSLGPGLRKAQRAISKRIVTLLGSEVILLPVLPE